MFSRILTKKSTQSFSEQIKRLKAALQACDAVVLGAGAGLSTAAGFIYAGERFGKYFSDFEKKYGFHDMYSGGFYPFATPEEHWAYWSRYIWVNRYMDAPKPVYQNLLKLVQGKDYFVITTNVDHQFQKAGFDKKRLFYTQGDYGLFQCGEPCCQGTYDNETAVRKMLIAQGYVVDADSSLSVPEGVMLKMEIPAGLVPRCLHCGRPMTMNLRCDDTFAEDEGWHRAAERYSEFLRRHKGLKTLFLDLGTGMNTPAIVKFSFWRMANEWPDATYACINLGEAYAPREIEAKSICINADIGSVLEQL